MNKTDRNTRVFFELLKGGLWEKGVSLLPFGEIDWDELYSISKDQAVVGLVAAGLEHVEDMKILKPMALPFLKSVFSTENRNLAMNSFISGLFSEQQGAKIETVLVKGQGIGQCYHRPLWRSAGDVDLLVNASEYEKAKAFLLAKADSAEKEFESYKHQEVHMGEWHVELHGTLHSTLLKRLDNGLDKLQAEMFETKSFREWNNNGVRVFLPSPDYDCVFVFSHILQHFYKGGIGLRQICDWCRLLYTFKDELDHQLLQTRLRELGIIKEWMVFGQFAIQCLGYPSECMPLYEGSNALKRHRANLIKKYVLKMGNFGHNLDDDYYDKYSYVVRKVISFWRKGGLILFGMRVSPMNSLRYFFRFLGEGIVAVAHGQ